MKKKVLVEGPILTQSGYGEHARFVMRSLRSQEDVFDIYAIPLNWGQTSWLFEDNEERQWIDSIINKTVQYIHQQGQFDIYVHVGIPNELKRKAPITIEVTAGIESNKVAPEWIDILNRECDKVITVSEHSRDGLVNTSWKAQDQFGRVFDLKLDKPIEVVGYPVKVFNKYTEEYAKEKFSLDYDFNFLCVAQWGPRKNLHNTIRWFLEEFKNDNVGLVCKVNHSNNSLIDRTNCENSLKNILKDFPDRKCKVYLLHGDLNEEEVHNLYTHPQIKAIINFGHGEGFGLPLFEAAYCGLPVIASDYSGHKDFLYMDVEGKKKAAFSKVPYDLKKIQQEAVWNGVLHPESEWAFVKPFGAKSAMRECFKDYGRFKGQAKKLKEHLINNKVEDIYKKLSDKILGKIYIEPQDFNGISFCISTNGKRPEKTNLTIKSIFNTIKNSKEKKEAEIIICGNVEPFKENKEIVLINALEEAENGYLAKLRNIAGDAAKYDVIVFLDDDILFHHNWLTQICNFSKEKGWDILGNKVLLPDYGRYWDRAIVNPHSLVDYDWPENDSKLYQSGCFWIMRNKIFKQNKWDETIKYYAEKNGGINEDIEMSSRLIKKGFYLIFDKNNIVWHNDDSYAQLDKLTLKKEEITKRTGINFFLEPCDDFEELVEKIK